VFVPRPETAGVLSAWLRRHQVAVYGIAVALALAVAVARPGAAPALESAVEPTLAALLYVTFLEVPFVRFRAAFADRRFLAAALALNFLAVPAVAWALTAVAGLSPTVRLGALFVLLTPCIDYVIAFTDLAGGDAERVTAATPLLMMAQLLLLPGYLWLFVGGQVARAVEAEPFVTAFLALVAAPLALAWGTELWAERSARGERTRQRLGTLPVPAMAVTLFTVVGSQFPRVRASLREVAAAVPVYVAFLIAMPLLARAVAGWLSMPPGEGRALVFTSVTRNSLVVLPLALALPARYELVPAVVVTQTLVELVGMVTLSRVVPRYLVPDQRNSAS